MAAEIPDKEPVIIQAGDTVKWTRTVDDYPSTDGWSLSYKLINEAATYDIPSTASGSGYAVTLTAAVTALYSPGIYSLIAWVSKDAERYTVDTFQLQVIPDKAVLTTGFDDRLTAEIVLAALDESLICHGASAWTHSYTIQGRSMTFRSPAEFMEYRAMLRAEIAREKGAIAQKQGKKSRNYIQFRI